MKKVMLWMLVIILLMLAAKNDQVLKSIGDKPQQWFAVIKAHIAGVAEYQQQDFIDALDKHRMPLSPRERNYVTNISKSSGDLLMFMNRHCDQDGGHLVLEDQHLTLVCDTARQLVFLDE
ncbi:hypothetical protein GCM10011369_02750 [Neiella marina]|uniref:Uncharacterized protein n=1 Tax=Neiella marina TaxID=508461 RepID=A0A8J2XN11_9GAMM|nr:hypothetical protein [Neiella marina]GGA64822.1 hypothetical protein GCM10011369_02750 [Neiella marina]